LEQNKIQKMHRTLGQSHMLLGICAEEENK
jgi:hypothetical protein